MTKPTTLPRPPVYARGRTSLTINYWLLSHHDHKTAAQFTIECNTCAETWNYDPPASSDPECPLPLSQLQCPNGCHSAQDTDRRDEAAP
jgi:hypothetical protein